MGKSCYFIGHSSAPVTVKPLLYDAIIKHITEYGVTEFYMGCYGSFDYMAARALIEIKKLYPHIITYMLLAYHPALRKVDIPKGMDSLFLDGQENVPRAHAITRLNQRKVDESDFLIAYVTHISSGSYKLLDYARAKEKKGKIVITNLAEQLK